MRIQLSEGSLIVELTAAEKICSCRRSIAVSADHIREVKAGVPEPRLLEVRVPGTFIPGVIKAGTYWTRKGKEFWYVKRGKPYYVTIELAEEAPFRRMVLGLDEDEQGFLEELERHGVTVTLEKSKAAQVV
ncbi:MAG: hypothetical protein U9Q03_04720 [Patescibacteria group bacterium]|nr:hypothetical protein [Patescibacteria group bacterium]